MINYELVAAWLLLIVTFAFGVMPLIGSALANRFASYRECLGVGFVIVSVIALIISTCFAVDWAMSVITQSI